MKHRTAAIRRKTRETDIAVAIDLDGEGAATISTGIPFLDHMLELLAKHSLMNIRLKAAGDLAVDYHHTVEDVGLCLGDALNEALGNRRGISRYGWAAMPMDDVLSLVAVDLGGRPFLVYSVRQKQRRVGAFDVSLIKDFLRALSFQARMNLHVVLLSGGEAHHNCEAIFKGLARSLRMACARDPRVKGVPSSKGRI